MNGRTRERQAVKDRAKLASDLESIESEHPCTQRRNQHNNGRRERKEDHPGSLRRTLTNSRDRLRINGEQTRRLERLRGAIAVQAEIERHEATLKKAADLQAESGRLSESIGQITATDDSVSRIETAENRARERKGGTPGSCDDSRHQIEADVMRSIRVDAQPVS